VALYNEWLDEKYSYGELFRDFSLATVVDDAIVVFEAEEYHIDPARLSL
jgi:hypothetical protein